MAVLLFLSSWFFAGPSIGQADSVQHRIAEQIILFPQEKLDVHTDRTQYVIGDTIWFRAHVVDAVLHRPVNRNTYVFVELIDARDTVVQRVRLRNQEGLFAGRFELPNHLDEGRFHIRAYTENLKNLGAAYFFHKPITIWSPLSDPAHSGQSSVSARTDIADLEITFYPEGGHLIEGTPNRIAFKALASDGTPMALKARLRDLQGEDYGDVETLYEGMGLIRLTPLPGRSYYLEVDGQQFTLPDVNQESYALKAERQADELHVSVLTQSGWQHAPTFHVLLHTRGQVHYHTPWDPEYATMVFETSDFPSGIVQILLLDADGNAWSERLVFHREADESKVGFQVEDVPKAAREQVQASISIRGMDGAIPLEGDVSISVTDDADVSYDPAVNIRSTLLLSSELKGYIRDPESYLLPGREAELDLLLMTHGWRRYDIPKAITQQYVHPQVAEPMGMEIRGRVENAGGRPVAGSLVSLLSWDTGFSEEVTSAADGSFVFSGFEAPDSLSFVIQAEPARGRNQLVLHLDSESFPTVLPFPKGEEQAPVSVRDPSLAEARAALIQKRAAYRGADQGLREIEIEEVAVEGGRKRAIDDNFSFYMPNDRRNVLTAEQMEELQPQTISDALRHIPFLTIQADDDDQQKVYIGQMQNNSMMAAANFGPGLPAVMVVDDMIIDNYDLDALMDPANIEKIGVLKGTAAMMLGGQGAGGAIVISTKKGMSRSALNQKTTDYIRVITPLGYQEPAAFYSPRYDLGEHQEDGSDGRTTIYWNPQLRLSEEGRAEFEFFRADSPGPYTVVIEGAAQDGTLIRYVGKIP